MASGDSDKVESFRLEVIVHSLTVVSSSKKYFVKVGLEKGNEVETGKMKKNHDSHVVFFESSLELNYRSTSDHKPKLKFWVYEFRDGQAYFNGKCNIEFHEFYDVHSQSKDLLLKKCSDTGGILYLTLNFKKYKVVTSSFIAKVEGKLSSSSSSSSSSSDSEDSHKKKKIEKKAEKEVEKIVEKTEEKVEKIVEKTDEKIEETVEKVNKKIKKDIEKAAEKEEKLREKMDKEIEKILEEGENVEEKIGKVFEKTQEKIEKIEEKLEDKIEKIEEKVEEKIFKIEEKAVEKIVKFEKKAEKKLEKVEEHAEKKLKSSSSSSSSDEEVKKPHNVPQTHKHSTTPNSKSGSLQVSDPKGENKCSCLLL
jgi:hypothetical protein